ncbi:hypothetical protein PV327_007923 [Microctonus hyperodae]|uniref:Uncharacterized protein n=1 Tax=Microctonus hyperodae TaxID=165561 RepID=A0AA39G0X1_MICHY|nr:hypothetical protein PV327_007923 [Microctonus hyperodae]
MKRHGRPPLLLPLSLLVLATCINALTILPDSSAKEVKKNETTSTSFNTIVKSEPSISTTTVAVHPLINQSKVNEDGDHKSHKVIAPSHVSSMKIDEVKAKLGPNPNENRMSEILATANEKIPSKELPALSEPFVNPKNVIMQELNTLDGSESSNEKIQDEVAKVIKAQAQRPQSKQRMSLTTSSSIIPSSAKLANPLRSRAMKDLLLAETDAAYDDDQDEDDEDDEDAEDDDDDDDDDDSYDEDDTDDEEVMINCPDYCKCIGQYAAATTARCSKLIDTQSFGPSIAHLVIENAGDITLGPHELHSHGLDHLESITIVNTKISKIDRTAFDGIKYLFAVNLTNNGLLDIHPDTFQNNTQLSLLTVSSPVFDKQPENLVENYLFNAPSLTELDFSGNYYPNWSKLSFTKMPNLAYLNLHKNRLFNVDKAMFAPLKSLVELDLSDTYLTEVPKDFLDGISLETLKIAGNGLTTLANIRSDELNVLDASRNEINIIAKDDLLGVTALEQLVITDNRLKRIHQHAFARLNQLDHLDISNNNLGLLTEHHLRNNPRLQVLLMNNNPELGILPVFELNGFDYNSYSIYRFECANCGLKTILNDTFNAMPALTQLNLARNRLKSLPRDLFKLLTSLRVLDLSDNLLSIIPSNMLRGASGLTKLNIAGNPLFTLQITPFLQTPDLTRLDASRCQLRRIWSEARQPLKSLRFLSVRGNELERITVEELKAMPRLAGLDARGNPMSCDTEFNDAIQWLSSHGVMPTEIVRSLNYQDAEYNVKYETISQWSDLEKLICENDYDGPPARPVPRKPPTTPSSSSSIDDDNDEDEDDDNNDDAINTIKHGARFFDKNGKMWLELEKDDDYEDYTLTSQKVYHHWYNSTVILSIFTVVMATIAIIIVIIQFARHMANRKGGPVIRPPMILRQGLIDNKNCGLVYKPLQEEIATPHMPKRGSFYSSSTFHYDKIVPESV